MQSWIKLRKTSKSHHLKSEWVQRKAQTRVKILCLHASLILRAAEIVAGDKQDEEYSQAGSPLTLHSSAAYATVSTGFRGGFGAAIHLLHRKTGRDISFGVRAE